MLNNRQLWKHSSFPHFWFSQEKRASTEQQQQHLDSAFRRGHDQEPHAPVIVGQKKIFLNTCPWFAFWWWYALVVSIVSNLSSN